MQKTISFYDFVDGFRGTSREDTFSRDGLEALYDFLIEVEESTGVEMELDIIALCCEFTEYTNIEEAINEYDVASLEELQENTIVIMIDDESFIIQNY